MDELEHHRRRRAGRLRGAAPIPRRSRTRRRSYLGKAGATDRATEGARQAARAAERPAAGARINDSQGQLSRRRSIAAATRSPTRSSRSSSPREALDVSLPGRGAGTGGTASDHAHARAHRDAVPFARLRGRRRPRDRGRLPQLHRAQHAGGPSVALDARHVLRRRRHGAAHAHVADPGALHGNARAADQDHRAGPRLPRRQRRDALADVPSGRGPVDRRGRDVRRPEGRVHRVPAPAFSSATISRCASARRSSRSPSRRPRST